MSREFKILGSILLGAAGTVGLVYGGILGIDYMNRKSLQGKVDGNVCYYEQNPISANRLEIKKGNKTYILFDRATPQLEVNFKTKRISGGFFDGIEEVVIKTKVPGSNDLIERYKRVNGSGFEDLSETETKVFETADRIYPIYIENMLNSDRNNRKSNSIHNPLEEISIDAPESPESQENPEKFIKNLDF